MQILKIKLSQDEQDRMFNYLIKAFHLQDEKQVINFCEELTYDVEATLELYSEYSELDENNQNHLESRSVMKFSITFFHDGDEVEVQDWNIEDRIKKYYEV